MIFSIKPKMYNKLFGDLRKMKHTLYKNCPQVQFVDNLCAICVNPQNNLMSCFGLIDKKIVSETITATATKITATRGNNIKKNLQHWKKNDTTLQHYNIANVVMLLDFFFFPSFQHNIGTFKGLL